MISVNFSWFLDQSNAIDKSADPIQSLDGCDSTKVSWRYRDRASLCSGFHKHKSLLTKLERKKRIGGEREGLMLFSYNSGSGDRTLRHKRPEPEKRQFDWRKHFMGIKWTGTAAPLLQKAFSPRKQHYFPIRIHPEMGQRSIQRTANSVSEALKVCLPVSREPLAGSDFYHQPPGNGAC